MKNVDPRPLAIELATFKYFSTTNEYYALFVADLCATRTRSFVYITVEFFAHCFCFSVSFHVKLADSFLL